MLFILIILCSKKQEKRSTIRSITTFYKNLSIRTKMNLYKEPEGRPNFRFNKVLVYFFGTKRLNTQDLEIFKEKCTSSLTQIIHIINIIFQNLDFQNLELIEHQTKDLFFNEFVESLITEKQNSEHVLAVFLLFIDIFFVNMDENCFLTNQYFMSYFANICKIINKGFATFCNKNTEKINICSCFQDFFCIKYKINEKNVKNVKNYHIITKYGNNQKFDFFESKLIYIYDHNFEKIAAKHVKNYEPQQIFIIFYPNFIFVNSIHTLKTIFKMFFVLKNLKSKNTKLITVSFYEKEYKIIGILLFNSVEKNFYFVNLEKRTNKCNFTEFNNNSLFYLNTQQCKKTFLSDDKLNPILILKKTE